MTEAEDERESVAGQLPAKQASLLARFGEVAHRLDHLDIPELRLPMAVEFVHLLGRLRDMGVPPDYIVEARTAAGADCERCLAGEPGQDRPGEASGPPYHWVIRPQS